MSDNGHADGEDSRVLFREDIEDEDEHEDTNEEAQSHSDCTEQESSQNVVVPQPMIIPRPQPHDILYFNEVYYLLLGCVCVLGLLALLFLILFFSSPEFVVLAVFNNMGIYWSWGLRAELVDTGLNALDGLTVTYKAGAAAEVTLFTQDVAAGTVLQLVEPSGIPPYVSNSSGWPGFATMPRAAYWTPPSHNTIDVPFTVASADPYVVTLRYGTITAEFTMISEMLDGAHVLKRPTGVFFIARPDLLGTTFYPIFTQYPNAENAFQNDILGVVSIPIVIVSEEDPYLFLAVNGKEGTFGTAGIPQFISFLIVTAVMLVLLWMFCFGKRVIDIVMAAKYQSMAGSDVDGEGLRYRRINIPLSGGKTFSANQYPPLAY